jgi:hypothetical protein
MEITMAAADAKLQRAYPELFKAGATALYSFDGARIHQSATKLDKEGKCLLSKLGWTGEMQVPLPRYAPDLHKVIEHSHGRAEQAFRKWLYHNPKTFTAEQYKTKFEQIYRDTNTAGVIKADVDGLHAVYDVVSQNGGNWAPAKLR